MKPLRIRSAASQLRGAKVRSNIAKGDAVAQSLIRQAAPFMGQAYPEWRFHTLRKWRFDVAWKQSIVTDLVPGGELWGPWVAVEIEGGGWVGGAHSRGKHFESDLEKYAEAAALGWTVLRVSPAMVRDGRAAAWLRRIAERAP